MSEYQEEVLTNLLDLQAELRGEEPLSETEHEERADAAATAGAEPSDGSIAVSEPGLTVSVSRRSTPNALPVTERLAALNERLDRLERDLAGVTRRIEDLEPDAETDHAEPTDVDSPWRSFLDLQKIVADRLEKR